MARVVFLETQKITLRQLINHLWEDDTIIKTKKQEVTFHHIKFGAYVVRKDNIPDTKININQLDMILRRLRKEL
jgi:hypothetical protein